MLKDFKEFALKGNMIDMAVGIIIGAAFGKIITSLVNDIIMPPLGYMMGHVDFSELVYVLQEKTDVLEEVTINYGLFVNHILDFVLVAFAIFLVVRQMNKLKKQEEKAVTEKDCPKCCSTIDIKATKCPCCTGDI